MCRFDPDSGQTNQNAQFIPGYNPFAGNGITDPQGQANVKVQALQLCSLQGLSAC